MTAPTGGSAEPSRERIEQQARAVCSPAAIEAALAAGASADAVAVEDILQRAMQREGLPLGEVAVLLQVTDPALRGRIREAARRVHDRLFGRRIGPSVPICPTNRCAQDCLYCPLRRSNTRLRRFAATPRDMQRQIAAVLDEGHRHVNLVFGDDRSGVQYVRDMVWAAYGVRSGMAQIQRVDLNLDPPRVVDLRELRDAPLGTFHMFQETYHPAAYAALHPDGLKADYAWRLTGPDRAHEAGLPDVGLGVLLGAGDWRFDVPALLMHAAYLTAAYGRGPHTISYPRMVPAPGAPASQEPERQVSDEDFTFLVAVTRLAAPEVGIILSTPVVTEVRRELYSLGVSQVSVGSTTYPGVYTDDGDPTSAGALTIGRPRALEDLVYRMCDVGFVPNFCGVCFVQRRHEALVDQAPAPARAPERCAPNALLALNEYLLDYASSETKTVAGRLIQGELARLPAEVRQMTLELMAEAEAGLRGQML